MVNPGPAEVRVSLIHVLNGASSSTEHVRTRVRHRHCQRSALSQKPRGQLGQSTKKHVKSLKMHFQPPIFFLSSGHG